MRCPACPSGSHMSLAGSRGVHKLGRMPNPVDLQVDLISAPHGCRYSISTQRGRVRIVDQAAEEVAAVHGGGVGRLVAAHDRRVD